MVTTGLALEAIRNRVQRISGLVQVFNRYNQVDTGEILAMLEACDEIDSITASVRRRIKVIAGPGDWQ